MNFNIVNGHDNFDYEQIKKDYQNLDLSVKTIREKYDLSMGKWQRITKQFKEDGIPLRNRHRQSERVYRTKKFSGAKNYYYDKITMKWRVIKYIGGKCYYFGSYVEEQDAIDKVRELRQNNWEGLL